MAMFPDIWRPVAVAAAPACPPPMTLRMGVLSSLGTGGHTAPRGSRRTGAERCLRRARPRRPPEELGRQRAKGVVDECLRGCGIRLPRRGFGPGVRPFTARLSLVRPFQHVLDPPCEIGRVS